MASHVVYSGNVYVKFTGGEKGGFLSKKPDWKLRACDLVLDGSSCSLLVFKLKHGDKKIPFFKVDITRHSVLMTIEHNLQFYFYFQHDRDSEYFVKDKLIEDEWIRAIENCITTLIASDVTRSANDVKGKQMTKSFEAFSIKNENHLDELSVVSSLESVTTENRQNGLHFDRTGVNQSRSLSLASPAIKETPQTQDVEPAVSLVEHTDRRNDTFSTTLSTNVGRVEVFSSSMSVSSAASGPVPSSESAQRGVTRGRVLSVSSATSRVGEAEPVRRGHGRSVVFAGGAVSVSNSSDSLSFGTHNLADTQSPTEALVSPSLGHHHHNVAHEHFNSPSNADSLLGNSGARVIHGGSVHVPHPHEGSTQKQQGEGRPPFEHSRPASVMGGPTTPGKTDRTEHGFAGSSTGFFDSSSSAAADRTLRPLQQVSSPQYSSNTPYSDMRRSRTPGLSDVPALFTQSLTMEDLRVSDRHQLFNAGQSSAFSPDEALRAAPVTRDIYQQANTGVAIQQEIKSSQQNDSMRLREIQALAALNDELNAALESSEEGRRGEQEDFARQVAQLQEALEQSEAAHQQESERDEELASRLHALEEELRLAKEDALASKEIQHTQNQLMGDYHQQITALTERIRGGAGYVDVNQLEEIVSLARSEVNDLHAALEERERELDRAATQRVDMQQALDGRAEEVALKERQLVEAALARESVQLQLKMSNAKVDAMLQELGQQPDFALREGQLLDKVHGLERELQRAAVDAIAFRGSEESYKLSVVRLESLVREQQAFVDDMSRQLLQAGDLKKISADLTAQLNAAREDCTRLETERDKTSRNLADAKNDLIRVAQDRRDETARHDQQTDSLRTENAMLQSQLKKAATDETHLTAEVSVVQRHLEANREQYLQLERELHELQRHGQLETQSFSLQKASLQDSLEGANKTVRELQSRCRSLEELFSHGESDHKQRVQDLEEIISGLRRSGKDTVARTYLLEEQINKLTHSLTTERSSHTALLEQFEALQNQRHYEDVSHQNVTKELQESLDAQIRGAKDLKHQLLESELFRRDGSDKHVLAYREVNMSLAAAESSNRQLRDDMAALVVERQQERSAMEERIASQMMLSETCQLKILELERQLSTLNTARNIDQQRFSTIEGELQASVRRLTAAHEADEEVLREEHELNTNNRQLIASLRADGVAQAEEKSALFRDLRHHKELSATLQQELELLSLSSSRERADLLRSAEDLQGEVARAGQQLRQQTGALSDTVRELDAAKEQLSVELDGTMLTLEEYQLRFQVAEELNAALQSQLAVEQKERAKQVEAMQSDFDTSQSELAQSRALAAGLRQDLSAATESLSLVSAQLVDKERDCRGLAEDRRVQGDEIAQLQRHIENLKHDLGARERQALELTGQLEHARTTVSHQTADIAALTNEMDDLNARLSQGREHSTSSQARITQLEQDLKAYKTKLRDLKGLHEASTATFKDQSAVKDSELATAATKTRRLEELDRNLRQTISELTSKMAEMMPISEAERQLDGQRVALTIEMQAISSERQKYASRSEALDEKVAAGQRESTAALHRLRHLLASLSTYIEARDVTYEYKKGVGLSQAVVQYKDNTLEETLLSTEEHVGRLLRDFNALRSNATDLQMVLQREQLTHGSIRSSPNHSSESKHDRNSPLFSSPSHSPSDLLAVASVGDLVRDNQRLLDVFVRDVREKTAGLERQLGEEHTLKALRETLIEDLNQRIVTYEDQVRGLKQAKLAAEQRHSNEVTLIQQDYNRSLSEFESREDEHARATQALTRSYEVKIERLMSTSSTTADQLVQDERAICQSLTEKLNQQFSRAEASLKIEVDRLRSDCHHLQEQTRDLSREAEHKNQELHAAAVRFEALQHEVNAKVRQLETCLSQLERAELKAAKESREKLDLERLLRRFKSSAAPGVDTSVNNNHDTHNGGAPGSGGPRHHSGEEEEEEEEKFSNNSIHDRSHAIGLSSSASFSSHQYVTPRPASSSSPERDRSADSRYSAMAASAAARALSESRSRSVSRSVEHLNHQHTGNNTSSNNRDGSPPSGGLPRKGSFRITEYLDNQKKRRVASAERGDSGVMLSDLHGSDSEEGEGGEDIIAASRRQPVERADRIPAISQYRQGGEISAERRSAYSNVAVNGNTSSSRLTHSTNFAEATNSRIEQVMRAKGWSKTSM